MPRLGWTQNKVVILHSLWNNELNSYNPKEFLDKIAIVFKEVLSAKQLVQEGGSFKATRGEAGWDKKVQEQLVAKNARADSAYFVAVSSDLRLPTFNLGKLLFKNPPRSSKLTFTFHIYDGAGREVMGDTIINRGCLVKPLEAGKGSKFFYSDYKSFLEDLECHLAVIKKILQEKQAARKPKTVMET